MILEVEFVFPDGNVQAGKLFLQIVEELCGGTELKVGEDGVGRLQAKRVVQHRAGGTASVIAYAVEVHGFDGDCGLRSVDRRSPDGKIGGQALGIDAARVVMRE